MKTKSATALQEAEVQSVSKIQAMFEEVHGGLAIGKRNAEGERILEFAFANDPLVGNTWFKKKQQNLVTYQSGVAATTQVDFILYRRSFRKQVSNVKVIIGEQGTSQHRLLIGDFKVYIPPKSQSSVIYGACFLLVVVVNWLQSHVTNRLGASSDSYSPSSPTAICHF